MQAPNGATEALFRDRGTINLHSDVSVLCGDSPNSFFRHQCVHGVGHGLMAWTSYELIDALELCDRLEDSTNQRFCYSGDFMEKIVGALPAQWATTPSLFPTTLTSRAISCRRSMSHRATPTSPHAWSRYSQATSRRLRQPVPQPLGDPITCASRAWEETW